MRVPSLSLPLFLALALCITPAFAAAPSPDKPPPEIAAAEAYLNGIKNFKARFTQTDNMGQKLTGDFLLKRPGRMKFQYDAPVTDFIVADGLFIHYYDGEMKQESNAPIGQTLANFFLRKQLSFAGDLSVSDVKRDHGVLQITLTQTREASAGSLTLFFSEKPTLQLKKWRTLDAEGAVTEIELSDVRTDVDLESSLFHYYDPTHGKEKYN